MASISVLILKLRRGLSPRTRDKMYIGQHSLKPGFYRTQEIGNDSTCQTNDLCAQVLVYEDGRMTTQRAQCH